MEAVGKVDVVEKPIPEPGPDEAIVRTAHALVCTSDVLGGYKYTGQMDGNMAEYFVVPAAEANRSSRSGERSD